MRKFKNLFIVLFTISCLFLGAVKAHAGSPKAPVGANLELGYNYYMTSVPLKNFFKANTGFQIMIANGAPTGEFFPVDSDEYPTALAPNRWYWTYLVLQIPGPPYGNYFPAGEYTCYYQGTGSLVFQNLPQSSGGKGVIHFTVARPDGGGIQMFITSDDPNHTGDYVRNIQIFNDSWGDDSTTLFNPTYISLLKNVRLLRLENWMAYYITMQTVRGAVQAASATTLKLDPATTSDQDDAYKGWILFTGGNRLITGYDGASRTITVSPAFKTIPLPGDIYNLQKFLTDWSERNTPTSSRFSGLRGGMPVEYLVELCNETNASMWVNMPILANDDYIQQFATYVRDHLNPDLKIYVELSDELWNWSIGPGVVAANAMGQYLGIGGPIDYGEYRSLQIFQIFDTVFGDAPLRVDRTSPSRVVRVLANQNAAAPNNGFLDFIRPGAPSNGHKAYEYIDAFAIADYHPGSGGFSLSDFNNLTLDQLFASMQKDMQPGSAFWNATISNMNSANNRKLPLVAYEAGFSQYIPNPTPAEDAKLEALLHDARMRALVDYNLNQWSNMGKNATGLGVGTWNAYNFMEFGSFGFMDYWDQDPYAKKFGGILDYLYPPSGLPTILLQPSDVGAVVRSTATFTLAAAGATDYQWQKSTDGINFSDIAGAVGPFYTTVILQLSDDGEKFRCVVSNGQGGVTSNAATLTVTASPAAPSIVTQPSNVTVNDGQIANFALRTAGTSISYQWQISVDRGSTFKNLLFGGNAGSYSTAASLPDSGTLYRCVVSNAWGPPVTSSPATLTVLAGATPASITVQPADIQVGVGSPATFSVKAAGSPPLSYQWKKNGTDIPSATSARYTTPFTTLGDSGEIFTCTVGNSFGPSVTSQGATLTVDNVPIIPVINGSGIPVITQPPQDQSVAENQTATFQVIATGNFPLTYQWRINGTNIPGALGASYTTTAVTLQDSGKKFSVVIKNSVGKITSRNAILTVTAGSGLPSITLQPADQTVTEGQVATFQLTAAGAGPLTYQWMQNGSPLSGNSAAYTTPPTTPFDNGSQFACMVSNGAGAVTSQTALLTVKSGSSPNAPSSKSILPRITPNVIVLTKDQQTQQFFAIDNIPAGTTAVVIMTAFGNIVQSNPIDSGVTSLQVPVSRLWASGTYAVKLKGVSRKFSDKLKFVLVH